MILDVDEFTDEVVAHIEALERLGLTPIEFKFIPTVYKAFREALILKGIIEDSPFYDSIDQEEDITIRGVRCTIDKTINQQ